MASSLAFWFETKNEDNSVNLKDIDTELHFNYWSLKSTNTNYLDVGVHISSQNNAINKQVKALKIYLPFKGNEMNLDPSLGALVCDDKTLLAAIFNSHILSTRSEDSSGVLNITLPDGKVFDFYTHIEEANDDGMPGVEIRPLNDPKQPGTILTFPAELFSKKFLVSGSKEERKKEKKSKTKTTISYFRFRIKINRRQNSISTLFEPRASSITSQFEETQIIDFRVNEARILPTKIREQMRETSRLKKVHFFLVREASAEYKAAHSEFKRCRILESEIWDKYLGHKNDTTKQHMLIYHWSDSGKNDETIDHFSAFSKFSSTTVTDKKIGLMVLFLIALGVISGIIANHIWDNITSQNKTVTKSVTTEVDSRSQYGKQYFPRLGKHDIDTLNQLPCRGGQDGE
ncbi:hypothetical protein JKP23_09550 [Vibrio vulnificus]|uniref:hypothetical protein n=1 Tax=Vibrio vulnificus TaxID=672 RepID=UPI001CDD23A6|nr:hypothetical protein [Vibrio vulnificus]MCA3897343.1 hypothetical protein [Vibrio vulnificus]MCU8462171.1 hypothetical protein [Vibrio vulnificus]